MKFLKYLLFFVIVDLFITNYSFSTGLGLYLPYEAGRAYDELDGGNGPKWNSAYNAFGLGFVFDTKVAENALMNYRLNAGFTLQHNVYTGNNSAISFTDLYQTNGYDYWWWKLAFDNTLGFGFVRTSFMRIWAGPQLRLGFGYGLGTTHDYDLLKFQGMVGLAPVVGVNFHLGHTLSICFDMGYRYNFMYGIANYNETYRTLNGDYSNNSRSGNSVYSTQPQLFMNLSLIFRINDFFGSESSERRQSKKHK